MSPHQERQERDVLCFVGGFIHGLTIFAVLAVIATHCTGCTQVETFVDADGEVYQCEKDDGAKVELCYYADSASELADLTGAKACGLTDRWWPVITNALGRGCRYSCTATTPGCNAKGGCFCPESVP